MSVESQIESCVSSDIKSSPPAPPPIKKRPNRFNLRRIFLCNALSSRHVTRPTKTSNIPVTAKPPLPQQTVKEVVARASTSQNASPFWPLVECSLCLCEKDTSEFVALEMCGHRACVTCLQMYLRIEINESRISISCPQCQDAIHPNEIRAILKDPDQYEKYEDFMVRRVLACDPDTRWCPAPDCGFAVIAAGCASCPKLQCERCKTDFCYHCKNDWHPTQTCDEARAQRSAPNIRSSSFTFSQDSRQNDIKPCPRCQVLIVKMDDGSCNHMMCAVCGSEFCWLCMKQISDLHYLSPSGCTFWGKKPWSRKKKILWQLGTLVGAPVGIALVAGIAVPALVIGIPVWVGRKLYTRYRTANKHKRNAAIIAGVTAAVVVSPVLAGLAVGIGVPILLFYVYGVVPVSLCRSGGCGVSTSAAGVRFEFDDETDLIGHLNAIANRHTPDNTSMDALSHKGVNPSIGEASLSMVSEGYVPRYGHDTDRESASNVGLSGSIGPAQNVHSQHKLEVTADVTSRHSVSSSSEETNASLLDDVLAYYNRLNKNTKDEPHTSGSWKASEELPTRKTSLVGIAIQDGEFSAERVRFNTNVSVINDSPVQADVTINIEERPFASKSLELRHLFFSNTPSTSTKCHDEDESTKRTTEGLPSIDEHNPH